MVYYFQILRKAEFCPRISMSGQTMKQMGKVMEERHFSDKLVTENLSPT